MPQLNRPYVSPAFFLLFSIGLLTAISCLFAATLSGIAPFVSLCLSGLFLIAALEPTFTVVSTLLAPFFPPRDELVELPTVEEIADVKTVLVIPLLLLNEHVIDKLMPVLYQHYISNRGASLYVGLATEFCDSPQQFTPEDEKLLEHVIWHVNALNEACNPEDGERFFILQRPRQWSAAGGRWMGYERKRGAVCDLIRYLRTGNAAAFSTLAGASQAIVGAEYVIVLDDDNELEDGGALQLIRRIRAPKHRPVIDPIRKVVVEGHAILQPSIGALVRGNQTTRFERFQTWGTNEGPRIEAAYDMIFDEGMFVGKAIICTRTFHELLSDRFPEDTILSHDVLEGCYLRCGLVHDVLVREDNPRTLPVAMSRLHRWIRGDCQSARWSLARVPTSQNPSVPNPLSILSRWKLLEIFSRSLVPVATFCLIVGSWFYPHVQPRIFLMISVLRLSPYVAGAVVSARVPESLRQLRKSLNTRLRLVGADLCREMLFFSTLPYLTWNAVSAISIALWRMNVTKRNLIDWRSTTSISLSLKDSLKAHLLFFRVNIVCACLNLCLLAANRTLAGAPIAAFTVVWLFAPFVSWWLAQPLTSRTNEKESRSPQLV